MLIKLGPLIAGASGTAGGQVFSHNRGGLYTRAWAKPVVATSDAALTAKAIFTAASQAWASLTAIQQDAWKAWAQQNQVTNRLGDQTTLDGHAAYVMLNARLAQGGITAISIPPVGGAPLSLTSLSGTFDIGAGDFEINFTPTPLGANRRLWVQTAIVNSAARNYVKNLYKLISVSAANVATGVDLSAELADRFGTLQVGQTVHYLVSVMNDDDGRLSSPTPLVGTIVTT